jgi:hypothetical protein
MTRVGDGGRADLPFSRPVVVEDIHEPKLRMAIEADPGECERLARHIGIEAIAWLRATLELRREGPSGLHVLGEMRANVRQMCVVSLDNFDTEIVEPIDLHFAPQSDYDAHTRALDRFEPLREVNAPDPIIDGRVDLGHVVGEFLVLGLDPYPRKPGAQFSYGAEPGRAQDESAFAMLHKLKKPDG